MSRRCVRPTKKNWCSSGPTATSPGAATRFPPTPTRSLRARRVHCQIDVRASNLFRGGSHNATQEDEVEANLKKLELLYDHTKFHIGLSLILTSAYITL